MPPFLMLAMPMLPDFSPWQWFATAVIFVWTGFVRSGLGFGGAALGLPLMLFVYDQPVLWIPVVGSHLLFFSGLTLSSRLHNVDWSYLYRSGRLILPAVLAGVFGLLNLPNDLLLFFIYVITLSYAVCWVFNRIISSQSPWVDRVLLVLGGYVSGVSLTGAPLMIAVFLRNVPLRQLRDTMFVLWFLIVVIKLCTLFLFAVPLNPMLALVLLPAAAAGHLAGLRTHDLLMSRDVLAKRVIGSLLIVVCSLGLAELL
jgi:uncharacterized protein